MDHSQGWAVEEETAVERVEQSQTTEGLATRSFVREMTTDE